MTSLRPLHALIFAIAASFTNAAAAQPAPAAADDDLELDAAPAPAPPPQAPAAPAAAGAAAAATSAARPRAAQAEAAPARAVAPTEAPAVNLERRAHTRPVPEGLTIGGYVQADYVHSALSEDQLDPAGAPLNLNRFLVRRARLRIDRGFRYAAATLELDANTVDRPSVGIRRAEAALLYRAEDSDSDVPLVMLSAGVLDLPFGYELTESARVRPFLERSQGSLALFPTEADVGVKLSGAVGFLRYALSLTNGEPLSTSGFGRDPSSAKDLTGRLGVDVPASRALAVRGGVSFAKGEGFHAGQPARKDTVVWRDTNEDGVASADELAGVSGAAATPSRSFERWVLGLDFGVSVRTALGTTGLGLEAFVASNYDRGLAPADPVATGFDLRHAGAHAWLVQDLAGYGLVGFRAGVYDPNSDLLEATRGQSLPRNQKLWTLSPLAGVSVGEQARLLVQYDFVDDHLGRDERGVPADLDNDRLTFRLQVEL